MKNTAFKSFLYIIVLFVSTSSFANESAVETFNRLYRNGDYSQALKKIEKRRASLAKQGKIPSSEYALTDFEKGLLVFEFNEVSIDEANEYFNKGFQMAKDYPEMFVEGQILYAKLLRRFGSFMAADSVLSVIKINEDHNAFFRMHHELVELHFAQGKYNLAIEEIRKEERHYNNEIEQKLGALKGKSSKDIARIHRGYADLVNLEAKILLKQGNVIDAKRIIDKNTKWIQLHSTERDVAYLDNIYIRGLYFMEKHNWRQAYLEFENFFEHIDATKFGYKYKEGATAYYNNLEAMALSLYYDNRDLEAQHHIAAYFSPVTREFGINSKRIFQLDLLAIKKAKIDKDYDKALSLSSLLLSNLEGYPKVHLFRKEVLTEQYEMQIIISDLKKAEYTLNQLSEISQAQFDSESPSYHLMELERAIFLTDYTNDIKKAQEIYNGSYHDVLEDELGPYHPSFFRAQNKMAQLDIVQDKYADAETILKSALQKSIKVFGFRDHRYATQLTEYSILLMKKGHYSKSYEYLEDAAEVFEDNSYNRSQLAYANMLKAQARLLILLGSYNDAKDKLSYAKQIQRKFSDSDKDVIEFAELYIKQGEFHKVEKVIFSAIAHDKELFGPKYSGLIDYYISLSKLYLIAGEYVDAEKYSYQSIELAKELFGEQSFKYAEALKERGNIHQAYGDYEEALVIFDQSMAIQKSVFGEDHLSVAITLMDIAIVKYYSDKNLELAEKNFAHVFKVIENSFRDMSDTSNFNYGKTNPFYADALKNLAFFQIENGDYDAADKSLEQANDIWVKQSKLGRVNINSADVLLLRGSISKYQGKYEKAISYYSKASSYYKRIFNLNHPKYAYSLSKLGQMYYVNGDVKKSVKTLEKTTDLYLSFIKTYFPSLSEREKNKYWSLIKNDFEFFNTLVVELGEENPELISQAYNNILATKALLLNSSIKMRESIMSSGDLALIDLFSQWVEKREYLVSILSMSPEQLREGKINSVQLEEELNVLEKQLSSRSKEFDAAGSNEQYTWLDVKAKLKTGEAAVEIVRFRKYTDDFTDTVYYAAFIVDALTNNSPRMVVLDNGGELESRSLKYYKNTVKLDLVDELPFNKFWKPIEEKLGGAKTVYVSLDGVYNQINIETLKSEKGFILDQYEIVVVNNTKGIIKDDNAKLTSSPKAFFVGNPDFYLDAQSVSKKIVKSLPGAEEEVIQLADFMKTQNANVISYMNAEATESMVKQKINEFNPEIIHIATHGFFNDKEINSSELEALNESRSIENAYLRSGVMLVNAGKILFEENNNFHNYNKEDGILTAYEAKNLRLDSAVMVVLSACETGVGKVQNGEGVAGLLSAFLSAGADNVIISLFKISDEVTTDLMNSYYRYFLASGSEREAFLKAKKDIREKYKSPIYWGAFVMVSR